MKIELKEITIRELFNAYKDKKLDAVINSVIKDFQFDFMYSTVCENSHGCQPKRVFPSTYRTVRM